MALDKEHLHRYREVGRLLWKYGRADLLASGPLAEILTPDRDDEDKAGPEELAGDLEKLGPSFIKLGQFLSTRADLLPPPYLEGLVRLQDQCTPVPFSEVEEVVRQELGVRISKAFSEFEAEPVAAASLGQVHRAALRDGRRVAVKVQRPAIRSEILVDVAIFEELARLLEKHTETGRNYQLQGVAREFRKMLLRELDYRTEAQNLVSLGENLRSFGRIIIPQPVEDYTSSALLTMDYVAGKKISELSRLGSIDVDGRVLADEIFRAYLQQILVDGLFHADPHPGNVFILDDQSVALIDLGMVSRIAPGLRESLLKLVLGISNGQADDVVRQALRMSEAREDCDEFSFRREVADLVMETQSSPLKEMKLGRVVMQVAWSAANRGFRLPPVLAIIAKTILHLERVGEILDPEFEPQAAIRRHGASILEQQLYRDLSPSSLFSALIQSKDFVQRLPDRIDRVLDQLGSNEVRLRMDTADQDRLINGIQKIANRITAGLIIASLIVGAALLARIDSTLHLLGYPALAIVLFILGALGGIGLLLAIFISDRG